VAIGLPDAAGREAILASHARRVRTDGSVDLARVARATSGLAGADLANVVNEAALLAVRGSNGGGSNGGGSADSTGATHVTQQHFDAAVAKQLRYRPGGSSAAAMAAAVLQDLD
jgi:ATP-dependent 26S proteasome regulatory subunit